MIQFTIQQLNNLLIGNPMAMELRSDNPHHRKYICICPYLDDGENISKYINGKEKNSIRFNVLIYEINIIEYDEWDWDYCDGEWPPTYNEIRINDIISIEKSEQVLSKYVIDFKDLKPTWHFDDVWIPLPD